MMPSSSQVYDHQLIFQIIFEVGQFYHWQNKGEEMRVCQKKAAACSQKEITAASKHRVGEIEVVVEKRRGGETKTRSIYKHSSISSRVVAVGGVGVVVGVRVVGEERRVAVEVVEVGVVGEEGRVVVEVVEVGVVGQQLETVAAVAVAVVLVVR
jgi:hypothetical protein